MPTTSASQGGMDFFAFEAEPEETYTVRQNCKINSTVFLAAFMGAFLIDAAIFISQTLPDYFQAGRNLNFI